MVTRRIGDRLLDNSGNWLFEIRGDCIYDTSGNWRFELRGDRVYDTTDNWRYELRGDRIYDTAGNWLGSVLIPFCRICNPALKIKHLAGWINFLPAFVIKLMVKPLLF